MPRPAAAGGRATSAPLLGRDTEPTLFELSQPGRRAWSASAPPGFPRCRSRSSSPTSTGASAPLALAEVSERDLVGPLHPAVATASSRSISAPTRSGSCTMKYNPKICDAVAALPGLAGVHPAAPASLHPGLARAARRARGGAVRDHRHGRRHPAARGRGGRGAHRAAAHAGLARRPGATRATR